MTYTSNSTFRGYDFSRYSFKTVKSLVQFAVNNGYAIAQKISPYYIYELYDIETGFLVASFIGYEF